MVQISIPTYRIIEGRHGKIHLFVIAVQLSSKTYSIEKSYGAFNRLHKEIKKEYIPPFFPPKKLGQLKTKLLEERRCALEQYLQNLITLHPIPKALLTFLELPNERMDSPLPYNGPTHQPCMTISSDLIAVEQESCISNIVLTGILQALYSQNQWFY